MQTKTTFSKLYRTLLIAFALVTSKTCLEAANWGTAQVDQPNTVRGFTAEAGKAGNLGYTTVSFYWPSPGNYNQKEWMWWSYNTNGGGSYYNNLTDHYLETWWDANNCVEADSYAWITTPGWQGEIYCYSAAQLLR